MSERVLADKIALHHDSFAPRGTPAEIVFLGSARLRGWRLSFGLFSAGLACRVADIVESRDSDSVWGALYRLPSELVVRSDRQRSVLDRIEGHRASRDPENYVPLRVEVEFEDQTVGAWTYIGSDEARARCARRYGEARVGKDYGHTILAAAVNLGLPQGYLEYVEEVLASHREDG